MSQSSPCPPTRPAPPCKRCHGLGTVLTEYNSARLKQVRALCPDCGGTGSQREGKEE